jgi:hypothetical protein
MGQIRTRALTEQVLRGRMQVRRLLDQNQAACKVRRLASRTIRKPFDAPSEELLSAKGRGDWTLLELFIAGIRVLKSWLRLTLEAIAAAG